MEKRQELLNENLMKLTFSLSVPSIVGMLVVGMYSFVDAIFVGQWVGPEALGGISVAYPVTIINNAMAILVGMGSSSVLSRAVGRGNRKLIEKIPGNLSVLIFVISVVITFLGVVFSENLMVLSGASGRIKELGAGYLRIVFLGSFFVNFSQSANMLVRGEGKMKIAMLIMGIGAMLNILLDPVFIKILNMGIEGAAYATVLSQIIQFAITVLYFRKYSNTLKINNFKIDRKLSKEVFSIGYSGMMMQIMTIVQQLLIFNIIARFSDSNETIVMGAVLRYLAFAFIPVWGISQGFQPLVGTNYGAGKYDRVVKSLIIFCIFSTILTLIFWIPFFTANSTVLSLFVNDTSIIENYASRTLIFMSAFPLFGMMVMFMTLFQAIGNAKTAGILVMMRQIFFFIPLVLILPYVMGSTGVWVAFPATDVLVFIISVFMVRKMLRSLKMNLNEKTAG